MGLIQRKVERAGISTIGISIARGYTKNARPPRSVFLRWPLGHPLGEPFNRDQQRAVLAEALKALYAIDAPGEIIDLPFKWRRQTYGPLDTVGLKGLLCMGRP